MKDTINWRVAAKKSMPKYVLTSSSMFKIRNMPRSGENFLVKLSIGKLDKGL